MIHKPVPQKWKTFLGGESKKLVVEGKTLLVSRWRQMGGGRSLHNHGLRGYVVQKRFETTNQLPGTLVYPADQFLELLLGGLEVLVPHPNTRSDPGVNREQASVRDLEI